MTEKKQKDMKNVEVKEGEEFAVGAHVDYRGCDDPRKVFKEMVNERWMVLAMPCGEKVVMGIDEYKRKLLELEDIPCPCGNPNHWIFKFEGFDGDGFV